MAGILVWFNSSLSTRWYSLMRKRLSVCVIFLAACSYHRLRASGNTVVTMTSKVNGKMEILTPVDLKALKILKPKLDWIITSSDPTILPILWKSLQRGLLPILLKYNRLVTLCRPTFPSLFLVVAYSKNEWTDFHDVYIQRRGFTRGCAFWGFRWQKICSGYQNPLKPRKSRHC